MGEFLVDTGVVDISEDYQAPRRHFPPDKLPNIIFPKEKASALTDKIIKQARAVPGPGTYVKASNWAEEGKKSAGVWSFSKSGLDKGSCLSVPKHKSKEPGPGQYKADALDVTLPRVTGGPASKGRKKTFLENAVWKAHQSPAPNAYKYEKVKPHMGAPAFDVKKSGGERIKALKKSDAPGPGHYKGYKEGPLTSGLTEAKAPAFPFTKGKGNNFVDYYVKLRRGVPGPNQYGQINPDKVSVGTRLNTVYGFGGANMRGAR
ncbi:unnamed protein product [Vitrella brassicaformis CCMP3155]|uniref:Uncharacterized protein n=2 Tax=Vitrella brassicaformis TaxID=1169539 RepID=A0A0G4H7H2_VITBC|nr:unnamed protein product [Vitrella brassicaformis CCMP3155]|mmetsp:Transcript_2806/g.6427  ORF Transcript_2806/g.6427 Transcript_2806/m.6427 type:complete len:261 (+) Transcript_2806:43-825(+)|eukprot:CEM39840.1 unnamed protein product [Vitrella brassicaformis CCMP3155]